MITNSFNGVKNNDMKEYLLQHSWISPLTKGTSATVVGFALINASDFDLAYKIIAGILGAIIMILSVLNSSMDFRHKRLRMKEEEKYGYSRDKSDKSDE